MALEKLDRTVVVDADPQRAWQVVTDVGEITSWVGIVHSVKEIERLKSYTAVLEDKVGPFNLRADLTVSVDASDDGTAIRVKASGRDRALNSKIDIEGTLTLSGHPSGGTELTVRGSYQVTGRVATMGAGVVRKKGDSAVEQFFEGAGNVLNGPSRAAMNRSVLPTAEHAAQEDARRAEREMHRGNRQ